MEKNEPTEITESESDTEAKTESDSDTEAKTESDSDTEAKTESESESDTETDSDTESKTESDSETESKTESDSETEKKIDNISWLDIIKSDFEKGNFPKIDPFAFLPPFPAAAALQVMATLNNIFQGNKDKVAKLATISVDSEIAKKEHEIEEIKNDTEEKE